MTLSRRGTMALMLALTLGTGPAAWAAATEVQVSLWDKGGGSMDMMGKVAPMMMGMKGADMMMATMGITLDRAEVPAGEVTFVVTNTSKETIHEMVLSRVADVTVPLPYVEDEMRVDEDAAGHLGEVAETEPGKGGALTVTLEPGTYLLYCNIPGHYAMGMWVVLAVTP